MGRRCVQTAALFLITAATVFMPLDGWAQEGFGSIRGTVVDADANPVAGISVRAVDALDPTKYHSSVTDSAGAFRISRVPVGTYHVFPRTARTQWIIKDATPLVDVMADETADVSAEKKTFDFALTTSSGSGSSGE